MRRWVMLALLMALVLGVAWWFFFISPRNSRIAQASGDLEEARHQEIALRGQIQALLDIQEGEVAYLAALGRLETLIPEEPNLDELIDDVYGLCDATGVGLLNVSPSVPVAMAGSELREVTVAVTVEGEFFEILGFLFGVVDLERLVRVDSISISSGQDDAGATVLSVSLDLRLFTLADLIPVPEVPDDAGEAGSTGDTMVPEAQTTIVPSTVVTTTVPRGEG
ncbi:MAG: hypothetical protein FJW79_00735 [Actinobacteria bacterium]|nr:hypothetical protein [Actinomycetota bacterium]